MKDIKFDFKQLQAFIAVIETGSFTAAADKLKLKQSSVSQQINNLEKSLATQFINRSQRPIQMTIAGHALYNMGKNIIRESINMQERLNLIKKGEISTIKIGLVDSISKTIGIDILKFIQPKVKNIYQVTGTAPNLLSSLCRGDINLAITMIHTEIPKNIRIYPLIEEEFICICPKDWPENSLDELCKNKNYIAYASNTPTGIQTINWLKWNNFHPNMQFEIENADDILQLIGCGYGWTLTTPLFILINSSFFDTFKIIKINRPKENRKIALLCRDDELADFYQTLSLEIKDILENKINNKFKQHNLS